MTSTLAEGVALLRRGRTKKALEALRAAHEADPEDALVQSYYGVARALVDSNDPDAETLCFRAHLKGMGDGQLHANLAWVYHIKGSRKNAVASLTEALRYAPTNADALRIQGILGQRQPPPIRFLSRNNPINRALGGFLHRMKSGKR